MATPPVDPAEIARRVAAYEQYGGNQTNAAKALGVSRERVQSAWRNAGLIGGPEPTAGYEIIRVSSTYDADENLRSTSISERPERGEANGVVPPDFALGRVTVHEHRGEVVDAWRQYKPGAAEQHAARLAAFDAMAMELPRLDPVAFVGSSIAALCNLYTFTDYHLGALCWIKEGGANWDLKIAEATGAASFAAMLEQSPRARKAILNIQGDMLHTDGLLPVTPGHGHVLDADGRFSKSAGVAVRLIRRMIAMALERHEEVHVIICEGNHDESSSVWLRIMFAALYEDEPRVTVNDSELPFYVHQHGKVMLAFHHGHKVKNEALPMLFAAQFAPMWGATTKRYAHCGHRHHVDEKEYSGMIVTQHPTLAARDAYAARGGWISERAAQSITYHSEFGQVARAIVCPEMLEAAA